MADRITHPWQGHYMEPVFIGFVRFAAANLIKQFEAECGPINIGLAPIERMIDEATGQDVREVQRFIDWCVTQFGTPEQVGVV